MFSRNAFDLASNTRGRITKQPDYLLMHSSGGELYISKYLINDRNNILNKYKVIITYAMSGGTKPEIDSQLYAKYGLTDGEVAFIESMIRPME